MRGGDAERRAVVVGAVVQADAAAGPATCTMRASGRGAVGAEDRLRGLDLQLQVQARPRARPAARRGPAGTPRTCSTSVTFGSVTTARAGRRRARPRKRSRRCGRRGGGWAPPATWPGSRPTAARRRPRRSAASDRGRAQHVVVLGVRARRGSRPRRRPAGPRSARRPAWTAPGAAPARPAPGPARGRAGRARRGPPARPRPTAAPARGRRRRRGRSRCAPAAARAARPG